MKCLPENTHVNINGYNWNGCVLEDIELHKNVTVIVSKCSNCGEISLGWYRQPNTESHDLTEEDADELLRQNMQ